MYLYLFMLYKHGFCWARHKPVMVWLEFHIPTNDPGDCVNSTLLLLQGPLMRPTNPRPFFGLSLVLSLDHVAISKPMQLAPPTNQTTAMSVGSHRLRCQHHLDKQKQGLKERQRNSHPSNPPDLQNAANTMQMRGFTTRFIRCLNDAGPYGFSPSLFFPTYPASQYGVKIPSPTIRNPKLRQYLLIIYIYGSVTLLLPSSQYITLW